MKNKFLAAIVLSLLFIIPSCQKDLPFPINQVTKGVLVDVVRVKGTDGILSDGETAGNYRIKLTIPDEQGDYSSMKDVQLLAVLRNTDKTYSSKVVMDNITGFPQEIQIDMADIYSQFGLTAPELGQTLYFTANVVMNDGSVIPGWTELTSFNNNDFAGWQVDGRAYSSYVAYAATCPLDVDDFVGTFYVTLDEWWGEEPYPVEITKVSDMQLSIANMFNSIADDFEEEVNPLVITIDPTDHSISFAKQVLVPNSGPLWWGRPAYSNFALSAGKGTLNSCDLSISFSATATVDAGGFGACSFVIEKNPPE
ncbi:MAG: hypothetical protein FWD60_10560 [Candidatus Azobacteroides sp.]|nr:hypothetical protein [Candidatus Azobacteroides sp.]